jgi:hypothetical protein
MGVSRSYDCAVRKHAWEFAQRTLPWRGTFKTVFDALQLSRCGLVPPAAEDVYVAPRFATPTSGAVIFVDANNTGAHRGDGSKAKPFPTLRAAVVAAEGKPAATIVLRAGLHYTEGVVLTVLHSGLTIQNFEGENAIVSGAVPVPVKERWSLHNAATNTWRLDLGDWQDMPAETFGMRVGAKRATRARFPNGDMEVGTGMAPHRLAFIPYSYEQPNTTALDRPTQETVGPTGACQLNLSEGWCCPGNSIGFVEHVKDTATCCSLCAARKGCKAFTLNRKPSIPAPGGQHTCWLKAEAKYANPGNCSCGHPGPRPPRGLPPVPGPPPPPPGQHASNFHSHPRDWPGVYWLTEPEGGSLPGAGEDMAGTGAWFDAYNGTCSGRQAPYGYWCSADNPRSRLSGDPSTFYATYGGFKFADGTPLGDKISNWSSPGGAVVHVQGSWQSIQCLVTKVDNATHTVHFDRSQGCDQAGRPNLAGLAWYVDNVKVSHATARYR